MEYVDNSPRRNIFTPAVQAAGVMLMLMITNTAANAAQPELLWQTKLNAPIHMTPAISAERLVAANSKGEIYGFNRHSGEQKWKIIKGARYWDRSLVADAKRVYVGRAGGVLQAIDSQTGKLQWSSKLSAEVQTRPLLVDDTLYVPTTHVGDGLPGDPNKKAMLYALDRESGRIKWERRTDNYALQKPAFFNNRLFAAGSYFDPSIDIDEGGPMRVTAYNVNGEPQWEHRGIDGFVKAVHADAGAVAYVGYQDFITALNLENGAQLWRLDTGNWTPSLSGADGVIYFGSATTWVYAVASASGQVLWKFNIEGGSFNYLLGEPVLSGERLYFLTQKGDIHALDANTGELIWKQSTGMDARTGVAVKGDTLAIGGIDGSLRVYRLIPEKQ